MEIIIVGGSTKHTGGIERYCERFIQAFKLYGDSYTTWLQGNTAIPRQASKFKYIIDAINSHVKILKYINSRTNRHVVVWLQYGNAVDLFTLFLIRFFTSRIPLVTMHAGPQWRHLSNPILRSLSCLLLRLSKSVCLIAEWQVDFLNKKGILNTQNIPTLLPSWINNNNLSYSPRSGILFAGRISPDKGIKDLLYAYKFLVDKGINEKLVLAGTGDKAFLAECHQIVASLNLQNYVSWAGLLDENTLNMFLNKSILLVYPSYADAFSLTVLESLAAGTPVVAYDIPGTTDIIRQYGGTVVPLGDTKALAASLIKTISLPRKVDAEAIKATYNWKRVVENYENIVRNEGF